VNELTERFATLCDEALCSGQLQGEGRQSEGLQVTGTQLPDQNAKVVDQKHLQGGTRTRE